MAIKWLGIKKVKLDTILLPKGFAARKKEQHVLDLARSIQDSGVIALPVVRDKPRKLVAGGDRLAALMVNRTKAHEVRLVSGTDEELEALTIEENLWRRRGDDYNGMVRRLVELKKGSFEAAEEIVARQELDALPVSTAGKSDEEARPVGRPKTAKGLAREEVARATGKTPEAIRQAEKRARAEEQAESEVEGPVVPMPPPVDTFDLVLADQVIDDWFPRVRLVQEAMRDAGRKLDSVLRLFTMNLRDGDNVAKVAYSRTYQSAHDASDAIRRAMPESVCPWCKAQLHLTPSCNGCGETGFVSFDVLVGIAPELLERGADAKVPDGRGGFVLLTKAAAKKPNKPAKGARRLRIEDELGNELVPDDVSQIEDDGDLLF